MDSVWIEIALIVVGILANGFFAASEIALVSARTSRLAQLREAGVRGAGAAIQLKQAPDTFLATIQIAITAVGTLASAVGGAAAVEAFTPTLVSMGLGGWAAPTALAIVIVAITYVSLIIGELAPKAIALRDPERLAARVAPVVAAISRGSSALVRLLTVSTNALLRVIGFDAPAGSPFVSEEEVRYLVREGAAKGIFEKVEEELVHNVFEFGDTTVREVMTPRSKIHGLDVSTPPAEVLPRVAEIGHARIPVFDGSPERIAGIATLKDVVRVVAHGEEPIMRALLHPPLFVPETARISSVLRELHRRRQELAIVVDEYGSVVGLVTIEDLLEEIVGEIRDEGEAIPALVSRQPDGSFIVDGTMPTDEAERVLGLDLPDSQDYTTVAGFILVTTATVPTRGTTFVAAGRRWIVEEMDGARIRRVRVQPL